MKSVLRSVLRCYGFVERMEGKRVAERVYGSEVSGESRCGCYRRWEYVMKEKPG